MAGNDTGKEDKEYPATVFFICPGEDKQDLEPLLDKLKTIRLTATEHVNTHESDRAMGEDDEDRTRRLVNEAKIVVIYLKNDYEDGNYVATLPSWCQSQYTIAKEVKETNQFFLVSPTDLLDRELEATCQKIQTAHRAGAASRPVCLTPSEYNFLRIHTLLTTVAKEACQYLLHKRLKKLEQKQLDDVSKKFKTMQNTYDSRKKTLEKKRQDFEHAVNTFGSQLKKRVLDKLKEEVENVRVKIDALSHDKDHLGEECKELGDAVKEGFDDLKCRIIRLCVLQELTGKGDSGIFNDATWRFKVLKVKFRKAIEAFKEGKRSSQDFAYLSLEITLIIRLLKSPSLFKEDKLIFTEDKGEKRKPNDAHKGTAHVGDATSGEEAQGHQAEAGMAPDEQLKRKTEEDKAAEEMYHLRNYMSHLEFIDCMDDQEYYAIMRKIYSCSMKLVDDKKLSDSLKTKYDQIEALGQAHQSDPGLKSDPVGPPISVPHDTQPTRSIVLKRDQIPTIWDDFMMAYLLNRNHRH